MMISARTLLLLLSSVLLTALFPNAGHAQDLIQPPKEMVRYKLSNFQTSDGIAGKGFSFDYRRTQEGDGVARLVVRTNHGVSRIIGLPIRINESGTIRLRDLLRRSDWLFDMGEDDGIAFYLVVDLVQGVQARKQYLVSNVLKNKAFNLRIKGRPLSAEEKADFERQQLAKSPPKTVPAGFIRADDNTKLLPGVPIKFGKLGEWEDGEVVDFPTPNTVRVLEKGERQLRTMAQNQWVAIGEDVLDKIKSAPQQFESKVKTLPGSNLVLAEGVLPLETPVDLVEGTPLLRDRYGRWQDVYFLSCDNVSVRILSREANRTKVEFLPVQTLAIRAQSIKDQQNEKIRLAYAANVADIDKAGTNTSLGARRIGSLATGGFSGSSSLKAMKSKNASNKPSAATKEMPVQPAEMRMWVDQTGKFKIEASLIEDKGDEVLLKRTDQKTISVATSMLSDADQEYLKELANAARNPFNNVVEDSPARDRIVAASAKLDFSRLLQPILEVSEIRWGAKSVAISPDSEMFAIGSNSSSAALVDMKTGQVLVDSGRMEQLGNITVCGFSPNGSKLVIGGYKGVFEVYSVDSEKNLSMIGRHTLHNKEITAITYAEDGTSILSGDAEKTVRYWDLKSGQSRLTIQGFDGKIKATHISRDGDRLFATDGKFLKIASAQDGKVIRSVEVGRSHAMGQAAAFSPDGKLLAVGEGYNIDLWDVEKLRKIGVLEGKEINWSMKFAPDNKHLLSGGNGTIHIWNCEQVSKVQTNNVGQSFYIQALDISADGQLVCAPTGHGEIKVFEVPN